LAQKEGLEKKRRGGQKFQKEAGKIKLKKVVKNFLKTNDVKKTAEIVGISHSQTTRYLKSEEGARSLAEAFEKAGLGKEEIARIAKEEFLNYNKEKIVRSYGEGLNAREVEEMRDGRLAFNSLQFAAKYIEADANTIATAGAGEVSGDIAMLAIKNLVQKLDEKQLRVVKESIEVLLEKNLKVVAAA
jgi:predicted transcriptional regulator